MDGRSELQACPWKPSPSPAKAGPDHSPPLLLRQALGRRRLFWLGERSSPTHNRPDSSAVVTCTGSPEVPVSYMSLAAASISSRFSSKACNQPAALGAFSNPRELLELEDIAPSAHPQNLASRIGRL